MTALMVLKPKIKPYLMILAALAVIVVIADLILAAVYSSFYSEIMELGLCAIALLGVVALSLYYRWLYQTYEINEGDITEKMGIVAYQTELIPYDKIQDISIQRSFMGILLGMGSLYIFTAGEGDYEMAITNVDIGELNKAEAVIRGKMEVHEKVDSSP